ncbi:ion channel [Methyloceanibacter sp.]|uniref:ion channel n=1 Tax=Methyloceanibacter sp. TaxID=1965321 RepID=UPI002B7E1D9B|nr:ion channel [Methyloceanibacter sp.]HML91695.1 ion channel [Methyloceanibacter sp.]
MIVDVWISAVLHRLLGALQSLEKAVYVSTVTFTTRGFGDLALDEEWWQLTAFGAANGLPMSGGPAATRPKTQRSGDGPRTPAAADS